MLLHCSVQQHGYCDVRCKPTVCVVSILYFFQVNEKDSDEIGMERATPLISGEVLLDQRTGMIGTVTAADDEVVMVILRSMKSAVGHFVGDKKYLSA